MPKIIGDIERLSSTVKHSAHSEANKIIEDAQDRSQKIISDAEQKAEQEKRRIVERAQSDAELIRRQTKAQKNQRRKKEYLETREDIIDQVFNAAKDRLENIAGDEEEYLSSLKNLALYAAEILGSGQWFLSSNKKGMDLLTEERLSDWAREAGEKIDAEIEFRTAEKPSDIMGGLIVSDKEGRRTVSADYKTRLSLAREELREVIFRRLSSHE